MQTPEKPTTTPSSPPTNPPPGASPPPDKHPDLERLSAWLEDELTPTESQQLRAHVESCAHCQAEVEAFSALFQQVRSLPELTAPPAFVSTVMERIEAEEARGFFGWLRQLKLFQNRFARLAVPMAVAFLAFFMMRQPEQANLELPALEQAERSYGKNALSAPPGAEEMPVAGVPPPPSEPAAEPAAVADTGIQASAEAMPMGIAGGPADGASINSPTADARPTELAANLKDQPREADAVAAYPSRGAQSFAEDAEAPAGDVPRGAALDASIAGKGNAESKAAFNETGRSDMSPRSGVIGGDTGAIAGLGSLGTRGQGLGSSGYGAGAGSSSSSGGGGGGIGYISASGSASSAEYGRIETGSERRKSADAPAAGQTRDTTSSAHSDDLRAAEGAGAKGSAVESIEVAGNSRAEGERQLRDQGYGSQQAASRAPVSSNGYAPAPPASPALAPVTAADNDRVRAVAEKQAAAVQGEIVASREASAPKEAPPPQKTAPALKHEEATKAPQTEPTLAVAGSRNQSRAILAPKPSTAPAAAAPAPTSGAAKASSTATTGRSASLAEAMDEYAAKEEAESLAKDKKADVSGKADAVNPIADPERRPDAVVVVQLSANAEAQIKSIARSLGGIVGWPVSLPNARKRLVIQLPPGRYQNLVDQLKRTQTLGATPPPARQDLQRIWIELVPAP